MKNQVYKITGTTIRAKSKDRRISYIGVWRELEAVKAFSFHFNSTIINLLGEVKYIPCMDSMFLQNLKQDPVKITRATVIVNFQLLSKPEGLRTLI